MRHCAERIGFRLAMWQLQADSRSKTPMPPPAFLGAESIDVEQWPQSEDYRALLDYIDSLRVTRRDAQSQVSYAELAPCQPG